MHKRLTAIKAEKMDILEKTQSWKEEEFDVVLQFMRTILLRRKVFFWSWVARLADNLQTVLR